MSKTYYLFSSLVCALSLSACNPAASLLPGEQPEDKPIQPVEIDPNKPIVDYQKISNQLNVAKARWQKYSINHYIYTLQRSCFCPPESRKPMRIRVNKGEIKQVMLVPENINKPSNYNGALSVDGLFDLIQKAIDNKAANISVKYDARFGYPLDIAIDHDAQIADEETYYKASGLRTLKPYDK